jgi:hypothetical protein
VAARQRGESLVGTASLVPAWLLIEVTGPWGRDAVAESELGPYAPKVWRDALRRHGIRIIAIRREIRPSADHGHHHLRMVHLVAPQVGQRVAAHRRMIEDFHEVVPATESLAVNGVVGAGWEPDDERYVMVCTNGRHDSCCATFGRPLVRALRESRWAEQLWECSHIGGDRFAANIVLLPDSLYFGAVDEAAATTLLAAHDDGRLDLTCFRGRSTLSLLMQAAEHAVRSRLGLDGLDAIAAVTQPEAGEVVVTLSDGRAVHVGVERNNVAAPTPLTCKGRMGLAYPEWRITSFDVRAVA